MRIRDIRHLAQTVFRMRAYLREPLTPERAIAEIRARMNRREESFLAVAKKAIYENQGSPYRKVLLWAGCEYGDLADSVRRKGLRKTLEQLRDSGVYLTLGEFKSQIPICRRGLIIETREPDFNNPLVAGTGFQCRSSGSRSRGTEVEYNWDFISEEAANELVLYTIHGVADAPLAFWLPVLPCVSGIHNFLMNIRFGRCPERWFSQLGTDCESVSRKNRRSMSSVLLSSRFLGLPARRPELVDSRGASAVARWLEHTVAEKGAAVVRTYVSSAVRIAQAAIEEGINISGSVIFTGAEPLTERRAEFVKSAGARTFARYVATETGLVGASCGYGRYVDDMHVYLDRLAIIQRRCQAVGGGYEVQSFLFTCLLENTGKILLNTDMGDFGNMRVEPCSCLFGESGMDVHISEVRSYDKLTCEGTTLLGSQLDEAVGAVVEEAGGCPDDYQFWETCDSAGLPKLVVAVNPGVEGLNEQDFTAAVLNKLRSRNISITTQFWEQAKVLQLVRAYPEMTKGFKLLPIKRHHKQEA